MGLRWLFQRLPEAQPADVVFVAYVAFSGLLVMAFGWTLTPALWIGLSFAHLGLLGLGLWWSRQPLRGPSLAGFLRDIYPLVIIPFLYWELRYLSQMFTNGYHDAPVLRLEEALFGEYLAMTFSARFPFLWLSELFHLFYGFYWLLLPVAAGGLYLGGRLAGFRELVLVELVIFVGCYLSYIFFPVAGPHYEFPEIGGALADGFFYRLVHWVLKDGGSMGAAFPSSHVAVAVAILAVTWRHYKMLWGIMLPLVVGLTVGTVYGRFHYGVDALSGILVALVGVPVALYLGKWLAAGKSAVPGNLQQASLV